MPARAAVAARRTSRAGLRALRDEARYAGRWPPTPPSPPLYTFSARGTAGGRRWGPEHPPRPPLLFGTQQLPVGGILTARRQPGVAIPHNPAVFDHQHALEVQGVAHVVGDG